MGRVPRFFAWAVSEDVPKTLDLSGLNQLRLSNELGGDETYINGLVDWVVVRRQFASVVSAIAGISIALRIAAGS